MQASREDGREDRKQDGSIATAPQRETWVSPTMSALDLVDGTQAGAAGVTDGGIFS